MFTIKTQVCSFRPTVVEHLILLIGKAAEKSFFFLLYSSKHIGGCHIHANISTSCMECSKTVSYTIKLFCFITGLSSDNRLNSHAVFRHLTY